MNEYYYNGHTIYETEDGYYIVGEYQFASFDEAADWIDEEYGYEEYEYDEPADIAPVVEPPKLHTYEVYFASRDTMRNESDLVTAYSKDEAISKAMKMNPDAMYTTGCFQMD